MSMTKEDWKREEAASKHEDDVVEKYLRRNEVLYDRAMVLAIKSTCHSWKGFDSSKWEVVLWHMVELIRVTERMTRRTE